MKALLLKNYIRNYLEAFGKRIPVTAADLARVAGLSHRTDWHRQIRKAVEELVEQGCPIGGDQGGYMWITSYEDLQKHLNVLQRRQVALCNRIVNLYKAYHGIK